MPLMFSKKTNERVIVNVTPWINWFFSYCFHILLAAAMSLFTRLGTVDGLSLEFQSTLAPGNTIIQTFKVPVLTVLKLSLIKFDFI